MAAQILTAGKDRNHGGLQKPWRAILYAPTAKYPKYRLSFKVPSESTPDVWEPTTRSRADEAEARDLFAETEQWLSGLTLFLGDNSPQCAITAPPGGRADRCGAETPEVLMRRTPRSA